ncbi:hypothetical protein KR032_000451, partial [Drosophila birchii]
FSGPGSIPNAVHQYNVLRGAELAELRRRKERSSNYPVFCKVRCPGSDVNSMVMSRDLDVVTQLSLDSQTTITNEGDRNNNNNIYGDECGMGDSVRLCGGAESTAKGRRKGKDKTKGKARKMIKGPAKSSKKEQQPPNPQRSCPRPQQNGDVLEKLKNLHLEVCAELQTLVAEEQEEEVVKKPSPRAKKGAIRIIKRLKTKRQQGGEPQNANNDAKTQEHLPRVGEPVCYEDYYLPQPKWVDIMPSAMLSQGIKVNVCTCPDATPQSAYKFMEHYGCMQPESLNPFFQEDSDLDHEFADRKGYLRYVEPRPRADCCDESPFKDNNGAVDTCFVELERRPHMLSLLKSLSPMRYTSQCSELAQKTGMVPSPQKAMEPEVKMQALELQAKKRRSRKPPTTARSKQVAKASNVKGGRLPAGSQPEDRAFKTPADTPTPTPSPPPATARGTALQPARRQQKRRKPNPVVLCSKSLEDLKSEKLRIYNKLSFTHERIIGAVDRLQLSLLQLPPARQRSVQEQERRQRNAFQFCVRFARNFLYPLKGMIDDVRLTPVANFNSAVSNEACHRMMCVYGLMLQSLQCYQRQLRYFLLEQVAQKLSALIEMIYTMTNCCLDKNILARHDPVVESLLERCTRFLSFIEDMQAERIKLARETQRRRHLQLDHAPGSGHRSRRCHYAAAPHSRQLRHLKQEKLPRSHERYDLKMCLNDSKVYEPRVVPKERPKVLDKAIRRRRRNQAHVTATNSVAEPATELQSRKDDIRTQMQIQAAEADEGGAAGDTTSSMSLATVESQGHRMARGASPLREAMLEAVRRATRSQLQEVLDPMMRSLKAMTNEKMGPDDAQ